MVIDCVTKDHHATNEGNERLAGSILAVKEPSPNAG